MPTLVLRTVDDIPSLSLDLSRGSRDLSVECISMGKCPFLHFGWGEQGERRTFPGHSRGKRPFLFLE